MSSKKSKDKAKSKEKSKAIELESENIHTKYKIDMAFYEEKYKKEEIFNFCYFKDFSMPEFRKLGLNIRIYDRHKTTISKYSGNTIDRFSFNIEIMLSNFKLFFYNDDEDEDDDRTLQNIGQFGEFEEIGLKDTEEDVLLIIKHIVKFISNLKENYYFCKHKSIYQKKSMIDQETQDIMINKNIYNIDNMCICCHDESDPEKLLECCKCSVCLECMLKIKSCPNCRHEFSC